MSHLQCFLRGKVLPFPKGYINPNMKLVALCVWHCCFVMSADKCLQETSRSSHAEPGDATLWGSRDVACVIRLRVLRQDERLAIPWWLLLFSQVCTEEAAEGAWTLERKPACHDGLHALGCSLRWEMGVTPRTAGDNHRNS